MTEGLDGALRMLLSSFLRACLRALRLPWMCRVCCWRWLRGARRSEGILPPTTAPRGGGAADISPLGILTRGCAVQILPRRSRLPLAASQPRTSYIRWKCTRAVRVQCAVVRAVELTGHNAVMRLQCGAARAAHSVKNKMQAAAASSSGNKESSSSLAVAGKMFKADGVNAFYAGAHGSAVHSVIEKVCASHSPTRPPSPQRHTSESLTPSLPRPFCRPFAALLPPFSSATSTPTLSCAGSTRVGSAPWARAPT